MNTPSSSTPLPASTPDAPPIGPTPGTTAPPCSAARRPRSRRLLRWTAAALSTCLLLLVAGRIGLEVWAEHHWRAAHTALQHFHLRPARDHLACVLRVRPDSSEAHLLAGQVARRLGDYRQAALHLDRCRALQREETEAQQLERTLLRAHTGEVFAIHKQLWPYVLEQRPQAARILEALAVGFMEENRVDASRPCLDRWLQLEPDNPLIHYRLGWWYAAVEGADDAIREFTRALELDEALLDARHKLAQLLASKMRWRKAAEQYETLLRQQPEDAASKVGLARCRWRLRQRTEAITLLEGVLAADANNAAALVEHGRFAMDNGNNEQAERWLQRAYRLDPHDHQTVYQLCLCLQRLNRTEEAARLSRRVLEIEQDAVRTRVLGTKDLVERPNDPSVYFEMASILVRNGKEEQALFWLRKTVQLRPGHPGANRLLADYYERRGEDDRARFHRLRAGEQAPVRQP